MLYHIPYNLPIPSIPVDAFLCSYLHNVTNSHFWEIIVQNDYFSEDALINAANDSSGNPGLLLNSG